MENGKNEKYKLLGIRKRKSKKNDSEYYIAYVLYEHEYGFDILNCMVKPQQVNALEGIINDDTFELKNFLTVQYNSYTKSYNMLINFGL